MSVLNKAEAQLTPVLLGYDGRDLWFLVSFVMLGWLPMLLLPKWKYTPLIPIFPVVLHAVMYTICLLAIAQASDDAIDFNTFDGVHRALSNPNATLPCWLHYCLADLLIGRWIYMDASERGATLTFHYLIMVPCLGLTLLFCPTGLLLYLVAIRPLLAKKDAITKQD